PDGRRPFSVDSGCAPERPRQTSTRDPPETPPPRAVWGRRALPPFRRSAPHGGRTGPSRTPRLSPESVLPVFDSFGPTRRPGPSATPPGRSGRNGVSDGPPRQTGKSSGTEKTAGRSPPAGSMAARPRARPEAAASRYRHASTRGSREASFPEDRWRIG